MGKFTADSLIHPIVQAPLGGGASTPELAAAVSNAGGLGFLAAGYKSVAAVRTDLEELRSRLRPGAAFGINVFAPPQHHATHVDIDAYADALRLEAGRSAVELGQPRWDDDSYAEKVDLLCAEAVPVASFTFGCPSAHDVARLHATHTAVWVTVTTPDEADEAAAVGADALVAQGTEAGGHRGGFADTDADQFGLLALLQLVRARVDPTPALIATGGIATGAGVAAVLAAGADAAALGTAFMLCPEAATAAAHRSAIADGEAGTALTRAFTGRMARGIVNRFLREHSRGAPSAYPEVHHLTAPLRVAARERGDVDNFHLWAGQAYCLTESIPAAELVVRLADEARTALAQALSRVAASTAQAPPGPGAAPAKPS